MKTNWIDLFDKQITSLESSYKDTRKPKLLLHACCAPCSSFVIETLSSVFDITIFYYNPNIYPEAEYRRRFEELQGFLKKIENKVSLIEAAYNQNEYFNAVKTDEFPILKIEPERGERCRRCYEFRMKSSFDYAQKHGFDFFTTTLSISPYKDADKINIIGEQLSAENKKNNKYPQYLYADFKKRNGFKRSLEISQEFGLYRQDYCGCIFSIRE